MNAYELTNSIWYGKDWKMDYEPVTVKVDYDKIFGTNRFAYKKVIFNPPATIVIWADNTKTVVKCSEKDKYDFEKGLALCFMKRALGNKSGALNKVLKKETPNG